MLSSLRVQDRVIGRGESYRVFVRFEEQEVEDEVLPGDFPQLDARGLAPAPLLAVQYPQIPHCDVITDLRRPAAAADEYVLHSPDDLGAVPKHSAENMAKRRKRNPQENAQLEEPPSM